MCIALPYLGIGVCLSLTTWLALGLVLSENWMTAASAVLV